MKQWIDDIRVIFHLQPSAFTIAFGIPVLLALFYYSIGYRFIGIDSYWREAMHTTAGFCLGFGLVEIAEHYYRRRSARTPASVPIVRRLTLLRAVWFALIAPIVLLSCWETVEIVLLGSSLEQSILDLRDSVFGGSLVVVSHALMPTRVSSPIFARRMTDA